jgi:hypothetical protein
MTQTSTDPQIQARLDRAAATEAEAKAEQAVSAAQASRYSSLVPDLTKVKPGPLDLKGDQGGMAAALAYGAMSDAATLVARSVRTRLGPQPSAARLLVTSDPDLVQGTAGWLDLVAEIAQLQVRANTLVPPPAPPPANIEPLVALSALSAAASALPGVLSLFARTETLTSTSTTANDLAAAAAVVGALISESNPPSVKHDTFQLATRGQVYDDAANLAAKLPALEALTAPAVSNDAKALRTLIENTLTAAVTVPKGATRSPIATASFWQAMTTGENAITHVLLVKSETGATTELVEHRFMFEDNVFLAATASITFLLIDASTNEIRAAGTESATAQAHGKIDKAIKISSVLVERATLSRDAAQ